MSKPESYVVNNLLDFTACGYKDIEVLLPYQIEGNEHLLSKVIFTGSIKECYDYYYSNR